jgi:hypothetical protein
MNSERKGGSKNKHTGIKNKHAGIKNIHPPSSARREIKNPGRGGVFSVTAPKFSDRTQKKINSKAIPQSSTSAAPKEHGHSRRLPTGIKPTQHQPTGRQGGYIHTSFVKPPLPIRSRSCEHQGDGDSRASMVGAHIHDVEISCRRAVFNSTEFSEPDTDTDVDVLIFQLTSRSISATLSSMASAVLCSPAGQHLSSRSIQYTVMRY